MDNNKLEKKFIEYFEQEYKWACQALDRNIAESWEIVNNAEQRMLGVANFCQNLGLKYDFIEKIYEDYKHKINFYF